MQGNKFWGFQARSSLSSGLLGSRASSSVVVHSLSRVQLFVTPWTATGQASQSFPISHNLLKLMSMESVMPSNHLVLCCPLLLLPVTQFSQSPF